MPDMVNHPPHYMTGGIEVIDYMEAKLGIEGFRAYCRGCVIKYISRAGAKENEHEDLLKAQWYLNRLLSTYETIKPGQVIFEGQPGYRPSAPRESF